jgi:hypothetical protein
MRAAKWIIGWAMLSVAFAGVAAAQTTRAIGTVTAINGNSITLKSDSGTEMTISVADTARILRTQPGQRDLATATPIELKEIQVGDRMLVQGTSAGNLVQASRIIVMARSDIAQKQQQEQQAWQRGAGGIVTAVDPAASTVTVASTPGTNVVVHVTPQTVIRRYAPSSVKFSDAQPSTLAEIQKGDQLRARGTRTDPENFTADEIVSGSFRNIAGLITASDPAAGTITVNDILGKRSITVKVSPESQMRKLPPMMAQMIARVAHTEAGQGGGAPQGAPGQPVQGAMPPRASGAGQPGGEGAGSGFRPGGGRAPDFQQMLNRTPAVTLADLQKGDAVMLVATQGSAESAPTVITLVAGVEPILTAAPSGSAAAALLSSWNMSAGPAEGNP